MTYAQLIPLLKDISFWHILATTACGLVYKMFASHLTRTEETLKGIKEILNSVVTTNAVQDRVLEEHDRRINIIETRD